MSYHDLVESFEKPGCPICRLVLHSIDRYLESLLYESVVDANTQHHVRARRGLCDEHGMQLFQYKGQSLGIGILYQSALDEILTIIDETPDDIQTQGILDRLLKDKRIPSILADRLQPAAPCMACTILQDTEIRYLEALGQYIGDTRMRAALEASDGLCLPHFRLTMHTISNAVALRQIIDIQRGVWGRLKCDLDGFITKNTHQKRLEMTEQEGNSWRRAVHIGGERGVFGPDPRPARR